MQPPSSVVSCKFVHLEHEQTRLSIKQGKHNGTTSPDVHYGTAIAKGYFCDSIHVRVAFGDDKVHLQALEDDAFAVCIRIESSGNAMQRAEEGAIPLQRRSNFVVGERIMLPRALLLRSSDDDSADFAWIRAEKRSNDNKDQHNSPENSILYTVNRSRYPKWFKEIQQYYTHDRHVYLCAYVLRLDPLEKECDSNVTLSSRAVATVVAKYASRQECAPERGWARANRRRVNQFPTTKMKHATEKRPVESTETITTKYAMVRAAIRCDWNVAAHGTTTTASSVGTIMIHPIGSTAQRPLPKDVEEKLFWYQPQHAKTIEQSRDLSILQLFIINLPLEGCGSGFWARIRCLEPQLRQSWMASFCDSSSAHKAAYWNSLAKFSLTALLSTIQEKHCYRSTSHSTHQYGDPHCELLTTCADLVVEMLTSKSLSALVHAAFSMDLSSCMPTQADQRIRFAQFVDGVYTWVHHSLLQQCQPTTLSNLVDMIVAFVYQNKMFESLRLPLRRLLSLSVPDPLAFEAFSAQMREVYLSQSHHQLSFHSALARKQQIQCCWDRRWIFNSDSVSANHVVPSSSLQQMMEGQNKKPHVFSAWETLSFVHQLSSLGMWLENSTSLWIRSAFASPFSTPENDFSRAMHLTLDQKYRIFRMFPNGISTMAASSCGWVYGDYLGVLESATSIKVWFFAYAKPQPNCAVKTQESISARCIALHLKMLELVSCEQGQEPEGQQVLHVCVKVSHASFVHQGDMALLSSSDRHSIFRELEWTQNLEFELKYLQL